MDFVHLYTVGNQPTVASRPLNVGLNLRDFAQATKHLIGVWVPNEPSFFDNPPYVGSEQLC